jgi:hypothetical protein
MLSVCRETAWRAGHCKFHASADIKNEEFASCRIAIHFAQCEVGGGGYEVEKVEGKQKGVEEGQFKWEVGREERQI